MGYSNCLINGVLQNLSFWGELSVYGARFFFIVNVCTSLISMYLISDKLGNIVIIIECDSSAILNPIMPSLSVNYGSVY